MNVVLNFHKGDQQSAKCLLELLLLLKEGVDCTYHLQYGSHPDTLTIGDTINKFLSEKHAFLSTDLPDITVPQEMIDKDPNLQQFTGNYAVRTKAQKWSIFQWNLCVYKHIQALESFLMMEPDCVLLKDNWLQEIVSAWQQNEMPIFGHVKKGQIRGKPIPTHWAGCSVYNSIELRKLPLLRMFCERYENPWWKYRNDPGTTTANNCFYGPVVSGYDVSYDYFLFALYFKETTGFNDPMQWPLDKLKSREDLIFCDFKSKLTADQIEQKYYGHLPLLHGVKSDEIRERLIKRFGEGRLELNKL
jgi:hypothetical protein